VSKLYVGNCSFDVTEQQLRDVFSAYGDVASVSIITDRDTGRPRGFAFVEMSEESAAQAAIRGVNGTQQGGRTLTVNEAKPRASGGGGGFSNRGGGGGGGFGGRGGGRRW
jgi:RNA recognition motif-containing protein